jgi:uncharacterized protein
MTEALDSGPIETKARIGAMDVLRGVAVCGILLMNIPDMGLAWENPMPARPPQWNADWIAFSVQNVVFAGSMRGLFTLLFGAGMMVMLRQADDDPTSARSQAYFTRCFALMLLGVANFALFMWPGEILFNYGLAGLVLYQFRRAQVRVLLTASVAILAAMSIAIGGLTAEKADTLRHGEIAAALDAAHKPLTDEQKGALEARRTLVAHAHPTKEFLAEEKAQRTSFPGVLAWSTARWGEFNLSNFALIFLAESVGFMLLGVALFKLNVLNGSRSLGFYAGLAAGGYGLGLSLRAYLQWRGWQTGFEPNSGLMAFRDFFYEAGRLPTTLGLLGLVMVLYRLGALRWLEGGLKAIGRLALTNYIGQSVITSILFYALGWYDRFGFAQLMGICVLVWIFQGLFSALWLARWEMGPAEWLLRSLTYGRWQSLGRARSSAAVAPAPAE